MRCLHGSPNLITRVFAERESSPILARCSRQSRNSNTCHDIMESSLKKNMYVPCTKLYAICLPAKTAVPLRTSKSQRCEEPTAPVLLKRKADKSHKVFAQASFTLQTRKAARVSLPSSTATMIAVDKLPHCYHNQILTLFFLSVRAQTVISCMIDIYRYIYEICMMCMDLTKISDKY